MDLHKNILEIGCFELGANLSKVASSSEVQEGMGHSMPLPPYKMKDSIKNAAKWLLEFNKKKYMFILPEIALIEEMANQMKYECEAMIVIPCGTDAETEERMRNNLPKKMKVSVLNEPFFPSDFYPYNAMIVVTGYSGMNHAMVLPEVYRMAEHYSGFMGKKVFVPYVSLESAIRYNNWIEMKNDYFKECWRDINDDNSIKE